ncbi:hypothetical protein [Streptomyces sp. NPDC048603]|uniref:hypothetical protein n=1 Tax=Streptomyces sp. NPDC048603 TaxID=3365577 RepID=UPI0037120EEE
MTTTENATPENGDIETLDNHATGIEIKPLGEPATGTGTGTAPATGAGAVPAEELQTLDNHATGPRP